MEGDPKVCFLYDAFVVEAGRIRDFVLAAVNVKNLDNEAAEAFRAATDFIVFTRAGQENPSSSSEQHTGMRCLQEEMEEEISWILCCEIKLQV